MNERRQRALKNYAAIRIQAQWRRYITRETYLYVCQYRNDKAAIIQALCRGYFSRKNKYEDGRGRELKPATKNKLYVACSRARGDLYFVDEQQLKKLLSA